MRLTKTLLGYEAPNASMATWRNPTEIEIVSNWAWKSFRCPVGAIVAREIVMQWPCWYDANVFIPPFSMENPSWIENAYELLNRPGEWYLDDRAGWLYYIPRRTEHLNEEDVEAPSLQVLVAGRGTRSHPIHDLEFRGLTFSYATWLAPSSAQGYPDDQTGLRALGYGQPLTWSHAQNVTPTPGNVDFVFSRRVSFVRDRFAHLGAVGLYLATGSQHDRIVRSRFADISSAATQLGGFAKRDHHPSFPAQVTRDNVIADNVITHPAQEYYDAAGIFAGYTTHSVISHNRLSHLPYTGIAIGWGFGMTDPGRFPGCFGCPFLNWPIYRTPTTSRRNRIVGNLISDYLEVGYDGAAIYILGQQGASAGDGMVVARNVAYGKAPLHGGNVLYDDAGTRYIVFRDNATFDNTPGFYGPGGKPWGRDAGGCRPRGDLTFEHNYWEYPDVGYPQPQDICVTPWVPPDVVFRHNIEIRGGSGVPAWLLAQAGPRP